MFKINNFCSDKDHRSADSFYVAQVFETHLKDPGTWFRTKGLEKLFICGDHGPHFSATKTVYNETTFFVKYGVTPWCFFLCSYHAYNRCDGAGAEAKILNVAFKRARKVTELH